ncbi:MULTISPECIES: hypothetical protein [unclassified Mesorhizobium]|uniref:hypothetical protein n=1 Tax=unclassified Mesorhizobium TaxID=325217 RepID=UPI000F75900A|nr:MULTISPECIES: hypothetical protein [unclassified Mesorhizobium]AZO68936.1 hypothetical protein EJ075_31170 [Mesorhizobium sp. M6A.T.Cr.TU.016.01.1.1]RWP45421.1 MAG: hypothetical protein EOR06_31345 [Mesorhizobium sp.]RWQ69286.1 MAG: hypothetical protein EOS85_29550 [Mesorhizobium sp.]
MLEIIKEFFSSNIGQSLSIAGLIAIATQLLTARGRLGWSVTHQHFYQLPNPNGGANIPVRTQEIWVQNTGRAAIDGVEVTLNYQPQHYEIWSPRKFTPDILPNDRLALTFPSLAGKEFFRISIIDTRGVELPNVLSVRWGNGQGKRLPMRPMRVFPRSVLIAFACVSLIGTTTVFYFFLKVGLRLYVLGP